MVNRCDHQTHLALYLCNHVYLYHHVSVIELDNIYDNNQIIIHDRVSMVESMAERLGISARHDIVLVINIKLIIF